MMHFIRDTESSRASTTPNGDVPSKAKGHPKVAPLNLGGAANDNNVEAAVKSPREGNKNLASLLSPRYGGPLQESDPLCPGRTFDWAAVCKKDLSKESARQANKAKLVEVAKMRQRLLSLQKKYSMELALLENAEMRSQAERGHNFLTLKLQSVVSSKEELATKMGKGAFFFLDVDGLVSETSEWRAPFVVPYADELVLRLLDGDRKTVGTMMVPVATIEREDLEKGTPLTLNYGQGSKAVVWVKRGNII